MDSYFTLNQFLVLRSFCCFLSLSILSAIFTFPSATSQPLHSVIDSHWKPATATWYGSPEGDGSDGKQAIKKLLTPFFWKLN